MKTVKVFDEDDIKALIAEKCGTSVGFVVVSYPTKSEGHGMGEHSTKQIEVTVTLSE